MPATKAYTVAFRAISSLVTPPKPRIDASIDRRKETFANALVVNIIVLIRSGSSCQENMVKFTIIQQVLIKSKTRPRKANHVKGFSVNALPILKIVLVSTYKISIIRPSLQNTSETKEKQKAPRMQYLTDFLFWVLCILDFNTIR